MISHCKPPDYIRTQELLFHLYFLSLYKGIKYSGTLSHSHKKKKSFAAVVGRMKQILIFYLCCGFLWNFFGGVLLVWGFRGGGGLGFFNLSCILIS